MVLSDEHIREALRSGHLTIDPEPDPDAYGTMSVDLRLGDDFRKWNFEGVREQFGETPSIYVEGYDYTKLAKAYLQVIEPDNDGCVPIQRGEFLLGITMERVGFAPDGLLAGRVEGKSSLARLGLSVHFAPTLHTGWTGQITLELHNAGDGTLKVKAGDKICQLIVEQISGQPEGSMEGTRFQDQDTPLGRQ